MESESKQFEDLRKLMALKRHEQPPPEYFEQLPSQIISRIQHGEGRLNIWDRFSAGVSSRPSLVYAFGLTVCGALGLGALVMVREELHRPVNSSLPRHWSNGNEEFARQIYPSGTAPLPATNWIGDANSGREAIMEIPLFVSEVESAPVLFHKDN